MSQDHDSKNTKILPTFEIEYAKKMLQEEDPKTCVSYLGVDIHEFNREELIICLRLATAQIKKLQETHLGLFD